MKRIIVIMMALLTCLRVQAQWVNNPAVNTLLANCATSAAEVYVATDTMSGDTYVQWNYGASNGWSPWLQRLDSEGTPQWAMTGVHITTPNLATWSPGYALAAVEGGVVSCFRTADAHHWVVKINADGSFPWGEQGVMLFGGKGGGRSEVLAGDDGGVWGLGTDMDSTFLQYVNPDGSLRASTTINDPTVKCTNGILVPADNGVFVVYAKQTILSYTSYHKELYVAGYDKDGAQTIPETQLMEGHTIGASYVHYAVPDGIGGGYVYTWHSAIGNAYNTYVFHFNANGASTITGLDGVPVHTTDPGNYYVSADATCDEEGNLLVAYRQTDANSQSQDRVYVNLVTASGDKPWGEGILVADYTGVSYSDIHVDAFEYGMGFAVTYSVNGSTLIAVGYDLDGNELWRTSMSSSTYDKTVSQNSTGFHQGQNILAWVNTTNGGLYGQNIGYDGTMGAIEPPTPPTPCYAPSDFDGRYYYDGTTQSFGVLLGWTAPQELPLHYNLYREQLAKGTSDVIEIDGTATEYTKELGIGDYTFRLTAVHEDCESDYALAVTGEDYLLITVTSIGEAVDEPIVEVVNIYTLTGQLLRNVSIDELPSGVYLVQGLTENGNLVSKKMLIH